jgi:hypothetical protein
MELKDAGTYANDITVSIDYVYMVHMFHVG